MTRLLLLAILLLLVTWAFWRLVDGVIEALGGTTSGRRRAGPRRQDQPVKLARDPVCGTWVSPKDARSLKTGSSVQYFCSEQCRQRFESRAS